MDILKLLKYVVPSFVVSYLLWYALYPFVFNLFCVFCFLLVISWSFGHYLFEQFNSETISPSGKAVLVTGCDTGFGHQLAQRLDRYGFHVHAGVLFPEGEGANKLRQVCSKRLQVHRMDVTSAEEVSAVVDQIRAGGLPLWGVVNNAGIALSTPWDWGRDVEIFEKTFNVNVFGLVRVTKACIPLLRESQGRIVNVASLAGRMTVPWLSAYCMSKHAVRSFSTSLRNELIGSGIKVVTLEPTFYKTPIIEFEREGMSRRKVWSESPEEIKAAYKGEDFLNYLNQTTTRVLMLTRTNLDEVVDAMVDGVTLVHPKLVYRCCGYHDVILSWAVSHLPELILDTLFKFTLGLQYIKHYRFAHDS